MKESELFKMKNDIKLTQQAVVVALEKIKRLEDAILKPKKYETNKDFTRRCMGNAKMGAEYKDRDQRFAVCQTIWKDQFTPKNNFVSSKNCYIFVENINNEDIKNNII